MREELQRLMVEAKFFEVDGSIPIGWFHFNIQRILDQHPEPKRPSPTLECVASDEHESTRDVPQTFQCNICGGGVRYCGRKPTVRFGPGGRQNKPEVQS